MKFYLDKHIRIKHRKGELIRNYHCNKCSSSFTRKGGLEVHVKTIHEGQRFKCELCDHTTTQKIHLNFHIRYVHLKIKDQSCTLCEYKTMDKKRSKTHFDAVHLKIKYKCPQCDIETTHLCSHIQTVHNREKIRKYQCNLCEYTNINKTQMDTHKNKVHLGIRIKCEFFDNLYGSKYNMHRHVEEKHKSIPKKIKVFKCSRFSQLVVP